MGEMYEYFEDFPEENPANYVGDRFDPEGAKQLRARQAQERRNEQRNQAALENEIYNMIEQAKKSGAERAKKQKG